MPTNEKKHLSLPNGTTFPKPGHGLAWTLRHSSAAELTKVDKLHIASIIDAYRHLIECTQEERNKTVSMIREAILKEAKKDAKP